MCLEIAWLAEEFQLAGGGRGKFKLGNISFLWVESVLQLFTFGTIYIADPMTTGPYESKQKILETFLWNSLEDYRDVGDVDKGLYQISYLLIPYLNEGSFSFFFFFRLTVYHSEIESIF